MSMHLKYFEDIPKFLRIYILHNKYILTGGYILIKKSVCFSVRAYKKGVFVERGQKCERIDDEDNRKDFGLSDAVAESCCNGEGGRTDYGKSFTQSEDRDS